jgi:hypothetical protein
MAGMQDDHERRAMARAQKRFGSWREGRRRGQRIPGDLWRAATELVGPYSLEQVSTALGLNEQRLAARVAAQQGRIGKEPQTASIRADGFVEIGIPGDTTTECTIELQSADGGKLVVRVPVSASALVAQIAQALWGRGA